MDLCPKCNSRKLLYLNNEAQCQSCGNEFERERQGWDDED